MSTEQELCFRLDRERLRITDVQATAREAWKQMRLPGTVAHANALARGIDPQSLPKQLDRVIELRPGGAGVGTVDLIVVAAGKVAWDLWKYVILAYIRHHWGDHALKEKRAAARPASTKQQPGTRPTASKHKSATKQRGARQTR